VNAQTNKPELAQKIIRRHEANISARTSWEGFWQDCANYVMPRKAFVTTKTDTPSVATQAQLFDTTAIQANQIYASGTLAWMTPADSRWFAFDAPASLKGNDAVKQWFAACTEIAQFELSRSNFYSEIHEAYLNEGAFGTNLIFCEEGQRTALTFSNFDIGTFSIAEDDEGNIYWMDRCFRMSPEQLKRKFGEEALSEKTRKRLEDDKSRDTVDVEVLHAIYRRDAGDYDATKNDGENKPWASCYIEKGEKHLILEGGFNEQPAFAHRFLRWGATPWGWSPSWMALPEARQLNFLEKSQDALAEKLAFPPILLPDDFEGQVDLRAAGKTFADLSDGKVPREWNTAGSYPVGKDRAEWKREAIRRAYFVDMFQMFAQLEKQMTAREVAERASEKLVQFSPTFARKTTELFNPLLQRIWGVCIRAGLFPPPPEELIQQNIAGELYLPEPQITYSSKIALAIKGLENVSFYRLLDAVMPVMQVSPEFAQEFTDHINVPEAVRDIARNDGFPSRWIRPMEEVMQRQQQRAQAQAEMMRIQQVQAQAQMIQAAGSVKEDSVVGKQAMANAA